MSALITLLQEGTPVSAHRPWPRATVDTGTWYSATERLVDGEFTLLGLWGDEATVHVGLLDNAAGDFGIASLPCPGGRFPSVGCRHAPAIRFERAIADLYGFEAVDAYDQRPWLDHGRWPVSAPLAAVPGPASTIEPYAFLPAAGESLHQIAVGPVHAGIIEPGHFRFTANGEIVVRLEERLGYTHKGIEALLRGASLAEGARLAGRASGDSTVAYAMAFARAAESALDIEAPLRASWLRALMAELERLANHLGDIGAICNDAAFALMLAHCGVLRERVLRAADACFGHRLMRDCIVPGGCTVDPSDGQLQSIRELVHEIRLRFPPLVELYDNTASLLDRTVGAGRLEPALARRFGAGGYVGRASGRGFDARRAMPCPPYDRLSFDTPLRTEGDVNARVWIRIEEVGQTLSLVEQLLAGMPRGEVRSDLPAAAGEGVALAESFRGDVLAWLRLDAEGRILRCHLRDPSWFQWPLLEAVIEGNIVADFPLCNKSFNCSYSGHDL